MPRFSRWALRTACLYLGIGGTMGSMLLIAKALPVWPWIWQLRTSHIWMMLVGWMLHLVAGVAFWILPRRNAAGWRGNETLVWFGYGLSNSSILLILIGRVMPGAIGLAGLAGLSAAMLIGGHCWWRVGPLGIAHERSRIQPPA